MMKSKEEFDKHYTSELKGRIGQLESQRLLITDKYSFKGYKRNLKWLAVACAIAGISSSLFSEVLPVRVDFIIPISIGYAIVAGIYLLVMRQIKFKPVKQEYKQTVIPKIISFFDPGLKYNPEDGIGKHEFDEGGLFGNYSNFRSEDLVYGRVEGIDIRISDVECTRKSGSSKSGSNTVTVFKGFYVIGKLDGKAPSAIIIKPAFALGDELKNLVTKFLGQHITESIVKKFDLEDIQTGNDEFDKAYVVKSTDTAAAKAFLTSLLIQVIMSFQKELNLPVSFSLFENQIHIAVSNADLFEADVNTSFIERDITKQYFNYLNLVFGIIEAIQATRQ